MADSWYYVQKGNRHGPVALEVIQQMISNSDLIPNDYVWKKGFENWKRIKELPEFEAKSVAPELPEAPAPVVPKAPTKELRLKDLNREERNIYIRIGNDRGLPPSDYGPFSVAQFEQLFKEKRINGKTLIFVTGMKEWKVLGDIPDYESFFQEAPPVIQEADRREAVRKPFIARLFVQNNKKVFEGICRDISIGGMQILTDEFKGQAGDRISINVHPENTDHHFTANGVVVRILEGNSGFSFRFQGLSEEATRAVEKYLQNN